MKNSGKPFLFSLISFIGLLAILYLLCYLMCFSSTFNILCSLIVVGIGVFVFLLIDANYYPNHNYYLAIIVPFVGCSVLLFFIWKKWNIGAAVGAFFSLVLSDYQWALFFISILFALINYIIFSRKEVKKVKAQFERDAANKRRREAYRRKKENEEKEKKANEEKQKREKEEKEKNERDFYLQADILRVYFRIEETINKRELYMKLLEPNSGNKYEYLVFNMDKSRSSEINNVNYTTFLLTYGYEKILHASKLAINAGYNIQNQIDSWLEDLCKDRIGWYGVIYKNSKDNYRTNKSKQDNDDLESWLEIFKFDTIPNIEQLERVYKKLSSTYHPDLFVTEEEKKWAEKTMKIINRAHDNLKKYIQGKN